MTVFSYLRSCAAVSRGDTKCGSFWFRSRKSFMQRRRVSSGLNWKPHLTACAGFVDASRDEMEPFCVGNSLYPISVGTLSEVIPDNTRELRETCHSLIWECTVSAWPCLDDIDVVWGRTVHSCHTFTELAHKSSKTHRRVTLTHRCMWCQSLLQQSVCPRWR